MPRYAPYEAAALQGRLWTPAELQPNLYCWLDALTGTIESATNVLRMRDRSGRGMNHYQATGAVQPPLTQRAINGRRALSYANSGGYWMGSETTVSLNSATAFECAAVLTMTGDGASYARIFTLGRGGVSEDFNTAAFCIPLLRFQANQSISTYWNLNDRCITAVPTTPFIFRASYDGTNIRHWLNGAAGSSGTMSPTLNNTNTQFYTGYTGLNTAPYGGFVGEIIFVAGTTAFSTLNGQRLEGHLAWRWGMQDLLPASHPFRNAPPLIGA